MYGSAIPFIYTIVHAIGLSDHISVKHILYAMVGLYIPGSPPSKKNSTQPIVVVSNSQKNADTKLAFASIYKVKSRDWLL